MKDKLISIKQASEIIGITSVAVITGYRRIFLEGDKNKYRDRKFNISKYERYIRDAKKREDKFIDLMLELDDHPGSKTLLAKKLTEHGMYKNTNSAETMVYRILYNKRYDPRSNKAREDWIPLIEEVLQSVKN